MPRRCSRSRQRRAALLLPCMRRGRRKRTPYQDRTGRGREHFALGKISVAHLLATSKFGGAPRRDHAALRKHITVMRDRQRLVHVLLDQENGDPALVNLADDIEVVFDQQRRKAERWF